MSNINKQRLGPKETKEFLLNWIDAINGHVCSTGYIAEQLLGPLEPEEIYPACKMLLKDKKSWTDEQLENFDMQSVTEKRFVMSVLFEDKAGDSNLFC